MVNDNQEQDNACPIWIHQTTDIFRNQNQIIGHFYWICEMKQCTWPLIKISYLLFRLNLPLHLFSTLISWCQVRLYQYFYQQFYYRTPLNIIKSSLRATVLCKEQTMLKTNRIDQISYFWDCFNTHFTMVSIHISQQFEADWHRIAKNYCITNIHNELNLHQFRNQFTIAPDSQLRQIPYWR